jgi:prepilin-type N-terminal cleavage/methylation domain-containing protein
MKRWHMNTGERGYNLVEVLVAMAILGSVLLSIVALFYFGRANVYSGKQLSMANSVGVQIIEDLSSLNMPALYAAFNIGATTTLGDVVVNNITYANSIQRDTANDTTANQSTPPAYLTKWKNLLGLNNTKLKDAKATLILIPGQPAAVMTTTSAAAPISVPAAGVMRIRIVISWSESLRTRSVVFDTVKTNRPFSP